MNRAAGQGKPECAEEHLHGGRVTAGSNLGVQGAAERAEPVETPSRKGVPSAYCSNGPSGAWGLPALSWALSQPQWPESTAGPWHPSDTQQGPSLLQAGEPCPTASGPP